MFSCTELPQRSASRESSQCESPPERLTVSILFSVSLVSVFACCMLLSPFIRGPDINLYCVSVVRLRMLSANTGAERSGAASPMSAENAITDFLTTGRTGRRNALPDILGENANASTGDLPEKLEQLSCSEGDTNIILSKLRKSMEILEL